eukprot:gene7512-biopygen7562
MRQCPQVRMVGLGEIAAHAREYIPMCVKAPEWTYHNDQVRSCNARACPRRTQGTASTVTSAVLTCTAVLFTVPGRGVSCAWAGSKLCLGGE